MALGNPIPAEVPHVDLLTYAFEGKKNYDQNKVRGFSPLRTFDAAIKLTPEQELYFDSDDDSLSLTGPQVVTSVKRLIGGLKVAGIEKGDCVCLHLFNSVSGVTR